MSSRYVIPATYWLDYSDRHPVDADHQMAVEIKVSGSRATIEANEEQREYLLGDAKFYADTTAHDTEWLTLIRGARRTVQILSQ